MAHICRHGTELLPLAAVFVRMGSGRVTAESAQSVQTILLVQGEILVRSALAEYLRHCGYRVLEAANAQEARTVLNFHPVAVSLVLSEVSLPGEENGFSLARWVRESHPEVAVLLTSGVTSAAERAGEVCENGPAGKPYSHEDVLYRIQLQLQRAKNHLD